MSFLSYCGRPFAFAHSLYFLTYMSAAPHQTEAIESSFISVTKRTAGSSFHLRPV